jgi:hypothetical protein
MMTSACLTGCAALAAVSVGPGKASSQPLCPEAAARAELTPKALLEPPPSGYTEWKLAVLVPAGASEAPKVKDPFTGRRVKPERQLYLELGEGAGLRGDTAIAHDIVNGVVVKREVLRAVYDEKLGVYELEVGVESFGRDGKRLPEDAHSLTELRKCLRCHAVSPSGRLLAMDPETRKPDPELTIAEIYERRSREEPLPAASRLAEPSGD